MRLPPGYGDLVARHEQLDVPGRGSAKVRDPQPGCRRRTAAPAAATPCSSGDAGVLDSAAVAAAHPSGRLTAADNWPCSARSRTSRTRPVPRSGLPLDRSRRRGGLTSTLQVAPGDSSSRHPTISAPTDCRRAGSRRRPRPPIPRTARCRSRRTSRHADRAFTDTRWSAFTRAAQSSTHGYRHIYFGSGDRVSSRGGDRACRQSRPWRRRLAEDARGQESASTTSLTRCRSLSRIA